MESESEIRGWLRNLEQRVTRLETRDEESALRQSEISVRAGLVVSAGTAAAVFVGNLIAHWLGWL